MALSLDRYAPDYNPMEHFKGEFANKWDKKYQKILFMFVLSKSLSFKTISFTFFLRATAK